MQLYDSHLQQAINDDNCVDFQQALSKWAKRWSHALRWKTN